MAEILLYTETVNSSTLRLLRQQGIIPIRVSDTQQVRLVKPEAVPSIVGVDALLMAALEALAGNEKDWDSKATAHFIRNLRNFARKEFERAAPAETEE